MGGAPITPTLRTGALNLPAVLMQGITHIAPAAGLLLGIQFIAREAGALTPLAYAIAFLIVLLQGFSLSQLARHLPSAGGYYTYVSRTVGPRAGFLTAWLYFLYDPVSTAINLAYMGLLMQQVLLSQWGFFFPWWLFLVGSTLLIALLSLRGIELSVRVMLLLGIAEIAIVVALSVVGLLRPASGPVHGAVPAPAAHGLYMGVVLSIFSFTGFESVAPLAEETQDPRRNLPRAILGSILLMGMFYLFCSFALVRALGSDGISALSFGGATESPVFALARRLWGGAWLLLLFALLNSVLAVSIACTSAATRVFYAMGRAQVLPRVLGRVHPVHRTPHAAIWLQTLLTLIVGLGLGVLLGPADEFFFLGVVMTLGMVLVYSMGNLGVFLFYRGERRHEFSLLRHAACPLLASLALLWVGVLSVHPLPAPPICWAPHVVAGWLLLGGLLLVMMRLRGREHWLLLAGRVAYERTPEA